ncbi:LuxR C-terminal-related transcriptional regulator [Azospirillum sp. SYSU D00513]|uniref:LuxR C-terminal-related transcriptional regulator n=1 Tax=Azospirillum sp. SYSU D00513 TaxID=2812561 RepID=UPI0032B450A6
MRSAHASDENGCDAGSARFTRRQLEILALLKAGKANKEIAYQLGIGIGTVKQHVVALFKKLNVTNRAMAVSRGFGLATDGGALSGDALSAPLDVSIELRPVVVLSLETDSPGSAGLPDHALQGAVSAAVAGLDAVLVVPPDGGLDVIFGLHCVGEDDVLKAVAVARAVAKDGLRLRAGLSAGFVIGSMHRHGGWTGESVAGRVIGEARGLRRGAALDRVSVGERARWLIECAERDHDAPLLGGRGSEFDLNGRPRDRRRRPGKPPRLIGRQDALAGLDAGLIGLAAGSGGVLAIRGEVGMGKTNLCLNLEALCDERAIRCIHHRCDDAAWSLADTVNASMRRRRTEGDLSASLTVAARRQPLCLIVDDADQAGEGDAALLRRLMAAAPRMPLLLAVSGRPSRLAPLTEGCASTAVQLGRLTPDAIAKLVLTELGRTQPSERVQTIVELATGVPLFALELARHAGRAGAEAAELPLSCAALVLARVDRTRVDRAMLRLVAQKGEAILAELAGQWPGTPDDLQVQIRRAVRLGVLALSADEGRVTFSHPMIGTVLRQVLMPGWSFSPEATLPRMSPGSGGKAA